MCLFNFKPTNTQYSLPNYPLFGFEKVEQTTIVQSYTTNSGRFPRIGQNETPLVQDFVASKSKGIGDGESVGMRTILVVTALRARQSPIHWTAIRTVF